MIKPAGVSVRKSSSAHIVRSNCRMRTLSKYSSRGNCSRIRNIFIFSEINNQRMLLTRSFEIDITINILLIPWDFSVVNKKVRNICQSS